VVKLIQYGFEV